MTSWIWHQKHRQQKQIYTKWTTPDFCASKETRMKRLPIGGMGDLQVICLIRGLIAWPRLTLALFWIPSQADLAEWSCPVRTLSPGLRQPEPSRPIKFRPVPNHLHNSKGKGSPPPENPSDEADLNWWHSVLIWTCCLMGSWASSANIVLSVSYWRILWLACPATPC